MHAPELEDVVVTKHYPKGGLDSDYYDVEVVCRDDEDVTYIATWGDGYHDDGAAKAKGFVEALKLLYGPRLSVIEQDIDDREEM